MSSGGAGTWQRVLSDMAKEWGTAEALLMNEAILDLHEKYSMKRQLLIGRTAMIVDDSVVMRTLMEEWLVRVGLKVQAHAKNGFEAVKLFNGDEQFDFVFLNVTMPELSGVEALTDFKKNHKSTIIMVTTIRTPELLLESIKYGAHQVLYRPFEFGMLLNAMCREESFSPIFYDAAAQEVLKMGKVSGSLDNQMTQNEVFGLLSMLTAAIK